MTSERSKRRDFLSLIFIAKSISKKLLIDIQFIAKCLISLSLCQSVRLSLYISPVRSSVHLSAVCLSHRLSAYLSFRPSACPSVRPSVRLSVLRPARPSISVCMSFYSLVCVFISKLLLGWVYSGSYSHTGPRSL